MSNTDSGQETISSSQNDTLVAVKTLMDGEKFTPETIAIKYSNSATVGPIRVGLFDEDSSEDDPSNSDEEFEWELSVGEELVLEEADLRPFERDVQVASDTQTAGQDGPVMVNIGGNVTTQ